MSKIKIGTASWNDRVSIYPSWCTSPEDRLRMYSSEFPMVEVDGSYHAIPAPRTTDAWARLTPEDFQFNVKAYRLLTCHHTQPKSLPTGIQRRLPAELAARESFYYWEMPPHLRRLLWEEFELMLEPLHEANKMGVVVFQFPPWFSPERFSVRHLEECKARLPGYRVGVEFRDRRWFDGGNLDKVLALLRRIGLIYIAVDGPQGLASSVPPVIDAGLGTCVVRFHGRNRTGWELHGPAAKSERCNYRYAEEEMMG